MGQALRRATGRVRPSRPDAPPHKPHRPPPPDTSASASASVSALKIDQDRLDISTNRVTERTVEEDSSVLEERDPKYDDMLKHMVGRITSRAGGRQEMGEAFIVERYKRPMPKLRSSREEAGPTAEKPLPQGTLNAEQIRQVLLLYQGKSDDYQGPMGVQDIAKKFRVDEAQVQTIVEFVSLPPENAKKITGTT